MKMNENTELLNHLERVDDEYTELMGKIPIEEKIVLASEEFCTLEPWEISEVVQGSLNDLPLGLDDHVDALFDVIYDAILAALDRVKP